MADDNAAPASPPAGAATASAAPSMSIIGQYVRDLSFENPNAPASNLQGGGSNPTFNLSINVNLKKQADDIYAVELAITAKASRESSVVFNVELVYGGVFRVKNVPEAQLPPFLMIEGARAIYPFARHALATTVQVGGFPPLMMDIVDFQALYIQRVQQAQKAAAAATPAGSDVPPALKN
jgi:preprotein translocase subunit SecB